MANFLKSIQYVLENEGGFSNVPQDRGGATNFGITQSDYSRWLKRPVSVQEVRDLPIETAKEIYRQWYWLPLSCDQIQSDAISTALFDIGVVRGLIYPAKCAQYICNTSIGTALAVDGHLGPLTLEAINNFNNDRLFIKAFETLVEAGFQNLVVQNPSQEIFLDGWTNRAKRLLTLV